MCQFCSFFRRTSFHVYLLLCFSCLCSGLYFFFLLVSSGFTLTFSPRSSRPEAGLLAEAPFVTSRGSRDLPRAAVFPFTRGSRLSTFPVMSLPLGVGASYFHILRVLLLLLRSSFTPCDHKDTRFHLLNFYSPCFVAQPGECPVCKERVFCVSRSFHACVVVSVQPPR